MVSFGKFKQVVKVKEKSFNVYSLDFEKMDSVVYFVYWVVRTPLDPRLFSSTGTTRGRSQYLNESNKMFKE